MIDIRNPIENYNKYKPILINLLVDYYGKEYSEMISKKINSVYVDFSSTPQSDYNYFLFRVGGAIPKEIYTRYIDYHGIDIKSKEIHKDILMEYLIDKLAIKDSKKVDYEKRTFLSLFIDENINQGYINFMNGYIDAFSSKNLSALNDDSIPHSIKESIINDQNKVEQILKSLEIDINLSGNVINEISEYRKEIEQKYRNYIAENSNYGKEMFNAFKNKFDLELPPDIIYDICSIDHFGAGRLITTDDNNMRRIESYIRVPMSHLLYRGIKAIDVHIIHELIHQIEGSGDYVGISIDDDDDTNNIANEIRTQIIAIKITKQLHELGIFIYDDPNDYKIEGVSDYEYLFPLAYDFFNEYDDFITDCAINNTPNKLDESFGTCWKIYSKYLNDEYQKFNYYLSRGQVKSDFVMNNMVSDLINNMKSSYNKGGVKNV